MEENASLRKTVIKYIKRIEKSILNRFRAKKHKHIRNLVEKIIRAEREDQKKFFNHARGKKIGYTTPKHITINEDIDLPEETNQNFLTQFTKKHLPDRDYKGKTSLIDSTKEALTWKNRLLIKWWKRKNYKSQKRTSK
jgi:hypothetical protein